MHACGYLHKNVKLSNILIFFTQDNEKQYKLSDPLIFSSESSITKVMTPPESLNIDIYGNPGDVW